MSVQKNEMDEACARDEKKVKIKIQYKKTYRKYDRQLNSWEEKFKNEKE